LTPPVATQRGEGEREETEREKRGKEEAVAYQGVFGGGSPKRSSPEGKGGRRCRWRRLSGVAGVGDSGRARERNGETEGDERVGE
jgi:hypothetical protein